MDFPSGFRIFFRVYCFLHGRCLSMVFFKMFSSSHNWFLKWKPVVLKRRISIFFFSFFCGSRCLSHIYASRNICGVMYVKWVQHRNLTGRNYLTIDFFCLFRLRLCISGLDLQDFIPFWSWNAFNMIMMYNYCHLFEEFFSLG